MSIIMLAPLNGAQGWRHKQPNPTGTGRTGPRQSIARKCTGLWACGVSSAGRYSNGGCVRGSVELLTIVFLRLVTPVGARRIIGSLPQPLASNPTVYCEQHENQDRICNHFRTAGTNFGSGWPAARLTRWPTSTTPPSLPRPAQLMRLLVRERR